MLENDFICTDCGGISTTKIQQFLSSLSEPKRRKNKSLKNKKNIPRKRTYRNNNSKKRVHSKRK